MATQLIDSGRIQLQGGGNVPMQRVTPQAVEPIGARVQAQGSSQIAEALDRMSAQLFQDSFRLREKEGLQFAAENELTPEQIEAAKNGDLKSLNLGGNPVSVFQEAVRKARALQLSQQFEAEGQAELVRLAQQIETGKATSEQVLTKITTMTDGFGRTLSKVDPEASYKFRATMATFGRSIYKSALDSEQKRAINEAKIKFELNFTNLEQLLENAATTDAAQFSAYGVVFAESIRKQAIETNDPQIIGSHLKRINEALTNARVNALTKFMLTEENLRDPRAAIAKLRSGQVGNLAPHVEYLMKNDIDSYIKVEKAIEERAKARKAAIELGFVDANNQGEVILRQMYSSSDPKVHKSLFDQLRTLPVPPETIKKARDFMFSDTATGPQRDDLQAFSRISQRVALGMATEQEIMSAPLTYATKKQLLGQQGNPNDDLSYGTKIIGMAVGIQSENLPPELKSADARQLATATRNTLVTELYTYARTPNEQGRLPTAVDIRAKGDELAKKAGAGMSKAFKDAATSNQNQAVLFIPQLQGVDLSNEQAVEAAFAAAAKAKANPTNINAARNAVNEYRLNQSKLSGASK